MSFRVLPAPRALQPRAPPRHRKQGTVARPASSSCRAACLSVLPAAPRAHMPPLPLPPPPARHRSKWSPHPPPRSCPTQCRCSTPQAAPVVRQEGLLLPLRRASMSSSRRVARLHTPPGLTRATTLRPHATARFVKLLCSKVPRYTVGVCGVLLPCLAACMAVCFPAHRWLS